MKMNFKKTIIAASIMAFSTGALAGWTAPAATKSVAHGIASNTQVGTDSDAVFELSGGVALTVGNMIVFKLTNGATFNTTGVSNLNALLAASAGGPFNLLVSPNANELRFEVITATVPTGELLTLDSLLPPGGVPGIVNLSAVPANGTVDILATAYASTAGTSAKAALNNISLKAVAPAGTGVYLFKSAGLATCGIVNESDTADVGELFKKFTGATTTGTGITNSVTVAANAGIAANKIIVKIAGDFTGIQKITAAPTGALTILGWKGSDASGNTAGGTANEFKIDGGFAYLANSAILPGPNPGGMGNIVATFELDGTTVQSERKGADAFKFSVDITDPVYTGATLKDCDKSTYAINRNGSSFIMNTLGTAVKLKISDVSGKDLTGSGKISFVGYKADGTEMANTLTSYALSKNGSVSIKGTDILDGFGATSAEVKKVVTTIESEAIIASSVRVHPVTGNRATIVYVNKADTDTGGI